MATPPQSHKAPIAPEVQATLAGLHFGLIGFNVADTLRISNVLRQVHAVATPYEEAWLGDSAHFGDALLIKLETVSSSVLQKAAASPMPTLLVAPCEFVLQGSAGAYGWARGFLAAPWHDAELLVRVFRLVTPAAGSPTHPGDRSQPEVLLADDDPGTVSLVEATLRSRGIACRTATDGLTALRLARRLLPDLLVLDVKMPVMDGFEVLEAIRRDPLLMHMRVALLTGCDDAAEVSRGSELHADDYLVKPLSPTVLLNRIKRLLAAPPAPDKSLNGTPPGGRVRSGIGTVEPSDARDA